eukprot:s367_g22.t1
MLEEKGGERETKQMADEDRNVMKGDSSQEEKALASEAMLNVETTAMSSEPSSSSAPKRPGEVVVDSVFDGPAVDSSHLQLMEDQVDLTFEAGMDVPTTPPLPPVVPCTPRHPHETRHHEEEAEVDHEAKKARVELQKKQKINQLRESQEAMIRTVKIGDDEFPTLDNYETELNLDEVPDDELWADEDSVQFNEAPDALWCDMSLDKPLHRLKLGWTKWLMN